MSSLSRRGRQRASQVLERNHRNDTEEAIDDHFEYRFDDWVEDLMDDWEDDWVEDFVDDYDDDYCDIYYDGYADDYRYWDDYQTDSQTDSQYYDFLKSMGGEIGSYYTGADNKTYQCCLIDGRIEYVNVHTGHQAPPEALQELRRIWPT